MLALKYGFFILFQARLSSNHYYFASLRTYRSNKLHTLHQLIDRRALLEPHLKVTGNDRRVCCEQQRHKGSNSYAKEEHELRLTIDKHLFPMSIHARAFHFPTQLDRHKVIPSGRNYFLWTDRHRHCYYATIMSMQSLYQFDP